jgi:endonuclease III
MSSRSAEWPGAGGGAPPSPGELARLRRRAQRIAAHLERVYGTPDLGNKADPLDELIFIILSQMTTAPSLVRVFQRLQAAIESWDDVAKMPLNRLKTLIKDAGLSGQKGPRIQSLVRRVRRDFGKATLDPLMTMGNDAAEQYLLSLPGVGLKTAKCVMMYSLKRAVLPVDTHVKRVLIRLGLLAHDVSAGTVHDAAEAVVPPHHRYSMHVNGVVHGRKTCLAIRPRCTDCFLRRVCRYATGDLTS